MLTREVNADLEFKLDNISINGQKKGCSGFVRNTENGRTIYVNTEYCIHQNLGYMYRFCDGFKDYGNLRYRNRFSRTEGDLIKGIVDCLTGDLPFGRMD